MDQAQLDQQEAPLPTPPRLGDQLIPSAKGVAVEVVCLLTEELHRIVAQELHMAMAVESRNLATVVSISIQNSLQKSTELSSLSMPTQPDLIVPHYTLGELQELVDNQVLEGSSPCSTRQVLQQCTKPGSTSDLSSNRSFNADMSHCTEELGSDHCCGPESIEQYEKTTMRVSELPERSPLQPGLPGHTLHPLRPGLPVLPGQLFEGHDVAPPLCEPLSLQLAASEDGATPDDVCMQQPFSRLVQRCEPLSLQLAASEDGATPEDVCMQQPFSRLVQRRASEVSGESVLNSPLAAAQHKFPLPASVYPLCLLGLLPWNLLATKPTTVAGHLLFSIYRWLVLAILGLSAGLCTLGMVTTLLGFESWEITHPCRNTLPDLPLILGTLAGVLLIGVHKGSARLFMCHSLVMPETKSGDLVAAWKKCSGLDVILSVTLWVAAVACRAYAADGALASLYLCAFAAWSGVLMGLCLCVLHLSNCLTCHVDGFSCGLVHRRQQQLEQQHMKLLAADFASRWNKVQATTRRCFNAIERLLIALQFSLVMAVVIATLVFQGGVLKQDLYFISSLLLLALIVVAFLRSAFITDRCRRVPSLVNTLVSNGVVDYEWQYLVRFISDSDAGCYIYNMPVTTDMVIRFLYFCGAFMFGVLNMNVPH